MRSVPRRCNTPRFIVKDTKVGCRRHATDRLLSHVALRGSVDRVTYAQRSRAGRSIVTSPEADGATSSLRAVSAASPPAPAGVLAYAATTAGRRCPRRGLGEFASRDRARDFGREACPEEPLLRPGEPEVRKDVAAALDDLHTSSTSPRACRSAHRKRALIRSSPCRGVAIPAWPSSGRRGARRPR